MLTPSANRGDEQEQWTIRKARKRAPNRIEHECPHARNITINVKKHRVMAMFVSQLFNGNEKTNARAERLPVATAKRAA
jgi:hypothetical protein